MSYQEHLFDLPDEIEPEQKEGSGKTKKPLLNYKITFVNNLTGTQATINLKYQDDAEFFRRFKLNYHLCTPIEVIKTNIKNEEIRII